MWFLYLGIAFTILCLVDLAVNTSHRRLVLSRLGILTGEATTSLTSTYSLSTKEHDTNARNVQTEQSYHELLPPHRRASLADLSSDSLKGPGKSAKELSGEPPDYSTLTPDKAICNTDDLLHHTTATGFTVEEIRRLGDFPDYATLSDIPLPNEYKGFNITTAMPRPYRPYRWPYHQTMSLMKLDTEFWLELNNTYVDTVRQRQEIFRQDGTSVLQALPGSELATKELMEMVLQFLCARYPQYFTLNKESMIFHNGILGTQTDLETTEPLHVLLNNVPEDFAIMIRDPVTGIYSFRAGMIISSEGWSLGTKIGLKLHEIHQPVPDYPEKMQFSMHRFFAKMPTDKPIQRGSWGFCVGKSLYAPPGHPQEKYREYQDPSFTIDQYNLRVDWQTLRRLPLSGAIVFNFKCLFTPVSEFRDEPYIPTLVLTLLREGKQNIFEYKSTWHTEHVVIPALEEYEREQIEQGLTERDWEPRTLDEAPFFPGWEEKWHRQQGF